MLVMKHASKIYPGGAAALQDVNVHIKPGEFVFLVGPSGAGKSTFIKTISREIELSSGQIFVDGVDVMKLRNDEIPYLRRQLGIVFQDYRLLNDRTAFENVAFAMQVIEAPSKKIKERVMEVLTLVGLGDRAKNYPSEMSGGEQQRVAVARALAHAPKLVIADEPTGNIDPELSLEMMELLERVSEMGITVLVVTHEHELVHRFHQRVVTLKEGRIISDVPADKKEVLV